MSALLNQSVAFFGGGQEWIIVLVLVLVLFGGKKIPELMRGVGKGMGELQKGVEEGKRSLENATKVTDEDTHVASKPDPKAPV